MKISPQWMLRIATAMSLPEDALSMQPRHPLESADVSTLFGISQVRMIASPAKELVVASGGRDALFLSS